MAFHVGQKVQFIGWQRDLTPAEIEHRIRHPYKDPELNAVYTIAATYVHSDGDLMLILAEYEINNPNWMAGWTSDGFRPLTDRKSEVSFTEGAPKESERFDNRRKHKERV